MSLAEKIRSKTQIHTGQNLALAYQLVPGFQIVYEILIRWGKRQHYRPISSAGRKMEREFLTVGLQLNQS